MSLQQSERIRALALELGFELVGITAALESQTWPFYRRWLTEGKQATMGYLERHSLTKRDPRSLLQGARSIVAVGLNYHQPNPWHIGEPHMASYALGRDYHKVIRAKLRKLVHSLTAEHPQARFRICVDSAPILEREYAHRAGLGWFGKNTMLINSQRGSWFLIGLLLTDLELAQDQPAEGGCGTCRKCIDSCPTGCIEFAHGRWQIDARRCISYLTIEHKGKIEERLGEQMGGWTFGCDVCQEVCPFNQARARQPLRAQWTREPGFQQVRAWPNLVQLAQLRADEWCAITEGSPVRRAGLEGLRRNAEINLRNSREKAAGD